MRHWLDNNNLIKNIAEPETHAEEVLIKPIAHENYEIRGDIKLICHEIE